MSMKLLVGIVMGIAAIGMVIGLLKQKSGEEWGQSVAIGSIIVALLCAFGLIFMNTTGAGGGGGVVDRELAYQRIGAEYMASQVAKDHPSAKVIVLAEPSVNGGMRETPLLEGIKAGLGSITPVAIVAPTIPQSAMAMMSGEMGMEGEEGPDGEMTPPLEMWFKSDLLMETLKPHDGNYDMVITTIGLPQDAQKLPFWKDKIKVAVASGSVYDFKGAIKAGYIVAAVTYNPNAVYDEKNPPSDLKEAFEKRYVLVTPATVDQVASSYPDLFRR